MESVFNVPHCYQFKREIENVSIEKDCTEMRTRLILIPNKKLLFSKLPTCHFRSCLLYFTGGVNGKSSLAERNGPPLSQLMIHLHKKAWRNAHRHPVNSLSMLEMFGRGLEEPHKAADDLSQVRCHHGQEPRRFGESFFYCSFYLNCVTHWNVRGNSVTISFNKQGC